MSFKTPKQRARMRIIQALYQWQLSGGDIDHISQTVLAQKGKVAVGFFRQTLFGIMSDCVILKSDIQAKIDHNIEEIPPTNLAILYLASYELKQQKLAKNIIINEAIELAKQYGTEKADKFINHLLEVLSQYYEAENSK